MRGSMTARHDRVDGRGRGRQQSARARSAHRRRTSSSRRGPAWSPDGRTILATATSHAPGTPARRLRGGRRDRPVPRQWARLGIRARRALAARRAIVPARPRSISAGIVTPQIWRVAYPGRRALARDQRSQRLYQRQPVGRRQDAGDGSDRDERRHSRRREAGKEPRRLTGGGARREDGTAGIELAAGRAHASSRPPHRGCRRSGSSTATDRTCARSRRSNGPATRPRAAPDGRYIYFQSFAAEGAVDLPRRARRLGTAAAHAATVTRARSSCRATAQALYFTAMKSGSPILMKIPADGGTPAQARRTGHFRAHDIVAGRRDAARGRPGTRRSAGRCWRRSPCATAADGVSARACRRTRCSCRMARLSVRGSGATASTHVIDQADRAAAIRCASSGKLGTDNIFNGGGLARRPGRDLARHVVQRRGVDSGEVGSAVRGARDRGATDGRSVFEPRTSSLESRQYVAGRRRGPERRARRVPGRCRPGSASSPCLRRRCRRR